MWISKSDLIELGLSDATIYRWDRAGKLRSTNEEASGREGRPSKLFELESLPLELQIRWKQLNEKRASADAASTKGGVCPPDVDEAILTESESTPPVDERLQRLAAALARFSPPEYEPKHKQAVERRCAEMATICDQVNGFQQKSAKTQGRKTLTIHSPGSTEAGKNRAYHPELLALANRTASIDPVYQEMYPSSKTPIKPATLISLAKEYEASGWVAFIREKQTLRPSIDERFHEVPEVAIDRLRSTFKSFSKSTLTDWGEDWLAWSKRHKVKLPFTDHRPGRPGTCYAWLYRWRKAIPQVAVTLATKGVKGVEDTYNYIIRDYSDLQPRDGWTMDWKTFDIDTWADSRRTKSKKPVLSRLFVCTVFDLVSKAVFGYDIADVPNARGVTRAYVNAIGDAEWKSEPGFENLRGMQVTRDPDKKAFVLWDNGKDFCSYAVEGREIPIKGFDVEPGLIGTLDTCKVGLAVDARIQVRHAKPFNAKSKIVEPFHYYAIGKWEQTMPGFKGRNSQDRPHWYAAARRIHERCFIKGKPPKSEDLRQLPETWRAVYERNKAKYKHGTPFLSEPELRAAFAEFVVKYNLTPHGSLTNPRGEMSPIEYVTLNAGSPHMMSDFAIAALLMESRVVKATRGEIAVSWFGQKFKYREVASELSDGSALMSLPMGMEVLFLSKPENLGRALVMNSGSAVCWVEEPTLLGYHANEADFANANAQKKLAQKTAKAFFETRLDRPDWRDEAEARSNVLPMMMAVGAEGFEERVADSEAGEEEPQGPQRSAEVAVITRFDRRGGSPGQRSEAKGQKSEGLKLVEEPADDWVEDYEPVAPVSQAADDDDWVD